MACGENCCHYSARERVRVGIWTSGFSGSLWDLGTLADVPHGCRWLWAPTHTGPILACLLGVPVGATWSSTCPSQPYPKHSGVHKGVKPTAFLSAPHSPTPGETLARWDGWPDSLLWPLRETLGPGRPGLTAPHSKVTRRQPQAEDSCAALPLTGPRCSHL